MYNNNREAKCKNEIEKIQTMFLLLLLLVFCTPICCQNIIENIYVINNYCWEKTIRILRWTSKAAVDIYLYIIN